MVWLLIYQTTVKGMTKGIVISYLESNHWTKNDLIFILKYASIFLYALSSSCAALQFVTEWVSIKIYGECDLFCPTEKWETSDILWWALNSNLINDCLLQQSLMICSKVWLFIAPRTWYCLLHQSLIARCINHCTNITTNRHTESIFIHFHYQHMQQRNDSSFGWFRACQGQRFYTKYL